MKLAFHVLLCWALLVCALPLHSQELVFDAKALTQAKEAFTTAKQSLSVVTDTLKQAREIVSQGKEILRIVGNPVALLNELGLSDLTGILREVGELADFGRKTMTEVAALANEVKSLTDPRLNMFSNGRGLGLLVNGTARDTGRYRGFAVFESQLSESNRVLDDMKPKLADLARRKSDLVKKLQGAKTENERENIRAGLQVVESAERSYALQSSTAQGQALVADAGLRQARAKDTELEREEAAILDEQAAAAARARNRAVRTRLFGQ